MTSIRAAAAEELYADGEGEDGDTVDGWTLVGQAQDHPHRKSRWHQRYWLIVRDHEDAFWGLDFGLGSTEMQENDFPWDSYYSKATSDTELPLTRLYPHTITRTEYRSKPAEVSA